MNMPVHLERSILTVSKEQWELEKERLLTNSLKFYQTKLEKNEELRALIKDRM